MSRRAAIYYRGDASRSKRVVEEAMREATSREGWTVHGTFVDGPEPSRSEYERLWRQIVTTDVDVVVVPTFAALGDGVSAVLTEILRLRDSGCDLCVLSPNLNTQSPVDRILFPIAEALKSIENESIRQPPAKARKKRAPARKFSPTPGQRSLVQAAISSGMSPRVAARSLKLPLGLVEAVMKGERK